MYSAIEIRKTSITDLETDAIVNAANEALAAGGGVCGAIFRAAGHRELQEACDGIGHCDTGDAVITPGFRLKAGYVIHAVGPRWQDGRHGEPEKLRSAYRRSLELATAHHCRSVGFPLISAGIFGYPPERAWVDAVSACMEFLVLHPEAGLRIVFAVLDERILALGENMLRQSGASGLRIAEKRDWKTLDMPERRDTFMLERPLTPKEKAALCRGNVPQDMGDKWFWYVEDGVLCAHRSWSGFCIYRIVLKDDGRHTVTVNRDPEQYGCTSIDEDREVLSRLLDRWTKPTYDYYEQWLSETADMLDRAGRKRNE